MYFKSHPEDEHGEDRPPRPLSLQLWDIAQTFSCTPSEAWREMGGHELTMRETRRLTLEVFEARTAEVAVEKQRKNTNPHTPANQREPFTPHEVQVFRECIAGHDEWFSEYVLHDND